MDLFKEFKREQENAQVELNKNFQEIETGVNAAVKTSGNETIAGIKNFKNGLLVNGQQVLAGSKTRLITNADIIDSTQVSELIGAFMRFGNIVICQFRVNCIKGFDPNSFRKVVKIPTGFIPYFAGLAFLPLGMTRSDKILEGYQARASDTGTLDIYAAAGNTYVSGMWVTNDLLPN